MKKFSDKPLLSIIIVSFNTKEVTKNCLVSLSKAKGELPFEVIVSDNGSVDGTVELIKNDFKWVKLIENKANLGFSKANNVARKLALGEFILFLNSDTLINKTALSETLKYLEDHSDVASVTCKIVLPDGKPDPDTRRSFPTPLVALTHFTGLDRVFPKSSLLSKYWYGYIDENEEHEVDVIQGAFHLSRKSVLDEVGWFDEDYFLDGEDIDLCWKIKHKGHKIVYFPKVSIVHIKKASKKKSKSSLRVTSGMRAMEIFYRKRLWSRYPTFVNYLVIMGIKTLLIFRLIKFKLT